MLQLEARRAGPVVLGQEPDFCSEGRLQVGRPLVLRAGGKGFLRKEGSSLSSFSADSKTTAKGWVRKEQSPRTTLVWGTGGHQEGSGDGRS